MRKIEFRAKRKDNNEWVFGYLTKMFNSFGIIDINDENSFYEIKEDTLGQFSGMYSKNKEKIYENDIIQIPDNYDEFGLNAGEIYEIYFAFGGFRLKPKYRPNARGFYLEEEQTYILLGNTVDNPELLD